MRHHRRRPLVDPDLTADLEVVSDQGYRGVEHDVDVVRINPAYGCRAADWLFAV